MTVLLTWKIGKCWKLGRAATVFWTNHPWLQQSQHFVHMVMFICCWLFPFVVCVCSFSGDFPLPWLCNGAWCGIEPRHDWDQVIINLESLKKGAPAVFHERFRRSAGRGRVMYRPLWKACERWGICYNLLGSSLLAGFLLAILDTSLQPQLPDIRWNSDGILGFGNTSIQFIGALRYRSRICHRPREVLEESQEICDAVAWPNCRNYSHGLWFVQIDLGSWWNSWFISCRIVHTE